MDFDDRIVTARQTNDLTYDDLFMLGEYDGRSFSAIDFGTPIPRNGLRLNGRRLTVEQSQNAQVYACPFDDLPRPATAAGQLGTRTYNMPLFNPNSASNNTIGIAGNEVSRNEFDISQPSNTLLFVENLVLNVGLTQASSAMGSQEGVGVFNNRLHPDNFAQQERSIPHHSRADVDFIPNFAFADGHVENLDPEETYQNQTGVLSSPGDQRGTAWDASKQ